MTFDGSREIAMIIDELPDSYRKDIRKAIEILLTEGCTEVYLFGSLARGEFDENSDIDLAVKGLPRGKYFEVGGKLMMHLHHGIDIIKIDDDHSRFAKIIKSRNNLIRVA